MFLPDKDTTVAILNNTLVNELTFYQPTFSFDPLIFSSGEEKGVAGDGLAGCGAGAGSDQFGDPGWGFFAAADFDQGTDNSAYHVAEEPVGADAEGDVITFFVWETHHVHMGWLVCAPACFCDGADGGCVVAPDLLETAEIMFPQKQLRCLIHCLDVERVSHSV